MSVYREAQPHRPVLCPNLDQRALVKMKHPSAAAIPFSAVDGAGVPYPYSAQVSRCV